MDTSVLIRCTIATTTQASFISSAVDCSATEWCDCIELASTNMDTTQGSQCNEPTEGLGCCSLILQEKKNKKKNIAIRGFCFVNHVKPLLFLVLKLLWQEIVKSDHLKSLLEM